MNLDLPKCSPFDEEKVIRLIAIDPGINKLGISVHEKDIDTGEKALIWAGTIRSNKFPKMYADIAIKNNERFAKLHGYRCRLLEFFKIWEPDYLVCENNYMSKYVDAYGSLLETVLIIRVAAMDYRDDMIIKMIEPSVVKKGIGVNGKSSDKNLVKAAVEKLDIIFHYPIANLDEHAIDSIAIGYCGLKNVEKEILV